MMSSSGTAFVVARGETPSSPLVLALIEEDEPAPLGDARTVTVVCKRHGTEMWRAPADIRRNGRVELEWDPAYLDLEAGRYRLYAEVAYRGGRRRIYPNDGSYVRFNITEP